VSVSTVTSSRELCSLGGPTRLDAAGPPNTPPEEGREEADGGTGGRLRQGESRPTLRYGRLTPLGAG